MKITKNNPRSLLRLMRPHQWIKNGFVLVGLIFSGSWHNLSLTWTVIMAAIAFCLVSSGVYIFNDIKDIEKDCLHTEKRRRPLAAGEVTVPVSMVLILLNLSLGLWIGYRVSLTVLVILMFYIIMNFLYSIKLKHVVILDVFIIASGFLLRILVGTVGVGIQPSSWLILCGIMISLFIGFCKRRAELTVAGGKDIFTRDVCEEYSLRSLDMFVGITAGCTILTYALYTLDPATVRLHKTDTLIYTLPMVMYGIFRYLYIVIERGFGGSPSSELYNDPHIVFTVVLWILAVILIIYR